MADYLAIGRPIVDPETGEITEVEPVVSSGVIKELYWHSEYHALQKLRGEGDDDSARKRLGSLTHTAVLEPHLLDTEFIVLPEPDPEKFRTANDEPSSKPRATQAYKEAVKALKEANPDKIAVEYDDLVATTLITQCIDRCEDARLLIEAPGKVELTVLARDPITGLRAKARFDKWLDCGWDLNIKGCRSAGFHRFQRDVSNMHFVGAGFYKMVAEWAGLEWTKAVILALELDAPHIAKPWEMGADVIDGGERITRWGLDRLALAMRNDSWPAYGDRIEAMSLTDHAYRRIDERTEERLPA